MIVMSKLRVLHVTLLNLMKVPKMEMRVGRNDVFWRRHNSKCTKNDIYILHNKVKVNRACSSIRYNGVFQCRWNKIYWMFSTNNRIVTGGGKIFGYTKITKTSRFTRNQWFSRFITDQGTKRSTASIYCRKNNRFTTARNTHRFTKSFSTNMLTRRTKTIAASIGGDKEDQSALFSFKAKETEALFYKYHYMNTF